jgi:hypothetical protein
MVINPTLVVEVLSDSTGANDPGEKFLHYHASRACGPTSCYRNTGCRPLAEPDVVRYTIRLPVRASHTAGGKTLAA